MAAEQTDLDVNEPKFSWSIPLELGETESLLDSNHTIDEQTNSAQEELIPREVIAETVGKTRLQAELERPIQIGTYNGLDAYLLITRFSFQQISSFWSSRIVSADINLVFESAPKEAQQAISHQPPAVAAFYPTLFEGEHSEVVVTRSMDLSFNASYMGAGVSVGSGQKKKFVEKSRIRAHGIRGGGRNRNSVRWTVEEDKIAKSGVPRNIELPLIVTTQSKVRFSASLTLKASYDIWRESIGRRVPVLGKNDEPVFFDPLMLRSLADSGSEKGPDGRLIAKDSGQLEKVDLKMLSTLR